ncbi:MAG: hypothetical protein AB7T07_11740 [Steroidobacteraceae bacterium]
MSQPANQSGNRIVRWILIVLAMAAISYVPLRTAYIIISGKRTAELGIPKPGQTGPVTPTR